MIAALVLLALPVQVPGAWSCADEAFGDGVCDCGCDAPDSDCDTSEFTACVTNSCPAGQAPWEHQNDQCMASTCGDGWKADDEACDDFNRLASGGCNADCSAVNEGFTCGEAAAGCAVAAEGEGEEGEGEEGEGEEGEGEEGEGEGEPSDDGCAAVPSGSLVMLLLLLRRRR